MIELNEGVGWTQLDETPPKPQNLSLMIAECEQLVQEFDYVRFDVYYSHGEYFFSEFTFAPSGLKKNQQYVPLEFDIALGEMFLKEEVNYDKIAEFLVK